MISRCIEVFAAEEAQATVEAAFLLPSFLLVLLLALQPICLFYTQAVMEGAAAETARLMVTAEGEQDAYRSFALRRLSAVPDVSIFHVGGPSSWDIECSRASDSGGEVSVSIKGSVRPLPVLGAFAGVFGKTDGEGNVALHVEASYGGRPEWLKGDYDSWISVWG